MVTAFNILYSSAAVRRLLGVSADVDVVIRKFFRVIWVWVKGKRPTFVSKQVFKVHFVEWRKTQARFLSVAQHVGYSYIYTVCNESRGSHYTVNLSAGQPICECEDFKNQSQFFNRACCKHGYAVLSYLGFSSLSEFIER